MKRFLSMTLVVLLLLAGLPMGVFAQEPTATVGSMPVEPVELEDCMILESIRAEGTMNFDEEAILCSEAEVAVFSTNSYQKMTTSQALLDIIKDAEGFSAYPYYDYSQYTIGYGSFCGYTKSEAYSRYPNGISRSEAEALLRKELVTFEDEINAYFRRIGRQPTQNQFDALVDFTYNVGGSWTYSNSYLINKYLMNPTTELDFLRAVGSWCRAGGSISTTLCGRRIREALIFLKGEYYLPYGNIESGLKVVPDDKLPTYRYCIFKGNGALVTEKYTDDVNYYVAGYAYGDVPAPKRSGYTFGWWQRSDGTMLSASSTVKVNAKVTAKWISGTNATISSYPKDPDDEGKAAFNGTVPSKPTPVTPPTTPPSTTVETPIFKDVSTDSWYSSAVQYVYEKGYMNGVSADRFDPDGTMTRGMLVTVLYRLAGKPSVGGSNPFRDVSQGQYYYDPVRWARNNNIVNGVSDTEFAPDELVSREQIAAILYRYYSNYLGKKAEQISKLTEYTDRNQISSYAQDAFGWAVGAGVINGTSATLLDPHGDATRAQAATMLQRFAKLVL